VYYGTDRQVTGQEPEPTFGTTRSDHLTFGEVEISIPRDHRMGVLESPSIWRFEFREDPAKHVMVVHTSTLDGAAFWAAMRHDILASSRKSVLLFIHGFNVSFVDAARRTAQMAYDLGFDGAPVFFSWPSQGKLSPLAYAADEQAIIDAQPHLEQFLRNILSQSGAGNVYLIAHSMGNRGLAHVLASLAANNPDAVRRIKAVILAAPDIGTTEFTKQIAPGLLQLGAPVTLYASSRDNALAASEQWHNGARLGESGVHLVVLDGIETIDASDAGDDLLGHSYYGGRTALSDMFYLIRDGLPASRRCCLHASSLQGRPYWVFMK
jgi:esterase/lipase superfamily enzyme